MAAVKWGVEVSGVNRLKRAMKVLGETDAPFLRTALTQGGQVLDQETGARAPGGIAQTVAFVGIKGTGATLRAVVTVKHPGAKAMEFGRTKYYRGYTGKGKGSRKRGTAFKASPGQKARPYLGVKKYDHAIGASKPRVQKLLTDAINATWESVAGGPG